MEEAIAKHAEEAEIKRLQEVAEKERAEAEEAEAEDAGETPE